MIKTLILHIFQGYINLIKFYIIPSYRKKHLKLFKDRLDKCESCYYLNNIRQCNECGCFVDSKTKIIYKIDNDGYAISYIDPITKDIYYACPKKYW